MRVFGNEVFDWTGDFGIFMDPRVERAARAGSAWAECFDVGREFMYCGDV